jgi:hypothetical protein
MTDPRWHTDNWLNDLWLPQPEDTIGGWCVTIASIPGTPASGNPPIADFCTEEVARHVAHLHNLDVLARKGTPHPPGTWMCPHCFDLFGPDDEDQPPVCDMCKKAGRT